jgi:hypothetical protein
VRSAGDGARLPASLRTRILEVFPGIRREGDTR